MRSAAEKYKPYQLQAPIALTATTSGSGVQFTPGNDSGTDAVAIVSLGAIGGAPSTTSVVVTIEQSATSGGTYANRATFATATAGAEVSTLQLRLDPAKPFVRATTTITFSGGTSPSIVTGVVILVKQNNNTVNNETALS